MPCVYRYIRVSHELSKISGAGADAQERVTTRLANQIIQSDPTYRHGAEKYDSLTPGVFADRAVSAFKVAFLDRPSIRKLLQVLKPGDVIVVAKTDRMFRSVRDMGSTLGFLERRKVRVVFGDIPCGTDSLMGELRLHMLVMFAQWESRMKSQRQREAHAARVAKGLVKKRKPVAATPVAVEEPLTDEEAALLALIQATIPKRTQRRQPVQTHAPRHGRIWIYARCSHLDSVESGAGLDWQKQECSRRAAELMEAHPGLVLAGEPLIDEAVSAWKHDMRARPKGSELHAAVQPGDVVLFSRLDRAFRTVRDMSVTLSEWSARGVFVEFVTDQIDLSDVWGRAALGMMAVFAEIEPALISTRTREALAELHARGRGWKALTGFLKSSVPDHQGHKVMYPDWDNIVIMRLCHILSLKGMGYVGIAPLLERLIAKREGRRPLPVTGIEPKFATRFGINIETWPHPRSKHGLLIPPWTHKKVWTALQRYPAVKHYVDQRRALAWGAKRKTTGA